MRGVLGGVYTVNKMVESNLPDNLIKPELQEEYPLWHVFTEEGRMWENLRILGTLPKPGEKIKIEGYSGRILDDPLEETTKEGYLIRRPSEKLGEI